MSNLHTIEIAGHKFEVDIDQVARIEKVDHLRVGDKVRVLDRTGYGDPTVKPGVIVGFEPFPSLPSVVVAVFDVSYSGAELKFYTINAKTEKVELIKAVDETEAYFDADRAEEWFSRKIAEKEKEIHTLQEKRRMFKDMLGKYYPELIASK